MQNLLNAERKPAWCPGCRKSQPHVTLGGGQERCTKCGAVHVKGARVLPARVETPAFEEATVVN